MIIQVFNSSVVSGPEKLVLPALQGLQEQICVVLLEELRLGSRTDSVASYIESLGHKLIRVPVRSRLDLRACKELARAVADLKPLIVHAHDVKASFYSLIAFRFFSRSRVKLTSTHHGVRGRPGFKNRLYENIYRRLVLRYFDRVLAVCSSDADVLSRSLPGPMPVVSLHLNGAGREAITPEQRIRQSSQLRQLWSEQLGFSLGQQDLLIGMVGRLAPEKRHDRAIEVLSYLRGDFPNIKLLLFGTGALESELRHQVLKLGLDKHVFFLGYRANVAKEMAGLDLLISLSDYEGLPVNLVEAAWQLTPVAATAIDGVNDLLPDDFHGLRLDVRSSSREMALKIKGLLHNRAQQSLISSMFLNRVQRHFSEEAWLSRLKDIYQQTLKGSELISPANLY